MEEIFNLPKDLKPTEILGVYRHDKVFTITFKRNGKLYGIKNVPHVEALPLILACKDDIRRRKNPDDRCEPWEAVDEEGVFSLKMYLSILESRRNG